MTFEHHEHLTKRKESGRRQPYLTGRNMTVGQLVYTMRANKLTAEQAAEDLGLPLEQVREAQAYYEVHRDVIEAEAEEEKQALKSQGVALEPPPVPEDSPVPPP